LNGNLPSVEQGMGGVGRGAGTNPSGAERRSAAAGRARGCLERHAARSAASEGDSVPGARARVSAAGGGPGQLSCRARAPLLRTPS